MPGRHILEGVVVLHETLVVVLHETLDELHRSMANRVISKLDVEKAHDNVKWSFLQQTLILK